MKFQNEREVGFTLIEVMVAMAIFVFIGYGMMSGFSFVSNHTGKSKHKSFATQKVAQIISELRALVETPDVTSGANVLDEFGDKERNLGIPGTYNYMVNQILTNNQGVINRKDPCDPLSGNCEKLYLRTIQVDPVINDGNARMVTVKVYLASTHEVLAESATILRTLSEAEYAEINYPLFILAIDNIPGWLQTSRGGARTIESSNLKRIVNGISDRNNGMKIKRYRIFATALGRDPFYKPYTNYSTDITNTPIQEAKVYHYPGLLNMSPYLRFIYNLYGRQWRSMTHVNWPSGIFSGFFDLQGASMADQYNHGVRFPEEAEFSKAKGLNYPTLRVLIEGMHQAYNGTDDFKRYRQATILNLHGRVFPMPPMRNYSDAAKGFDLSPLLAAPPAPPVMDPPRRDVIGEKYYRAVTHPENIKYGISDPMKLRVYSYVDPSIALNQVTSMNTINEVPADEDLNEINIKIIHPGIDSAAEMVPNISIKKLVGNSGAAYAWGNAGPGDPNGYTLHTLDSDTTLIRLYKSPLRHGANGNQGLSVGNRLYEMEYIPCLVRGTEFKDGEPGDNSLMGNGNVPKNTARWTISLPKRDDVTTTSEMYTIETRIGSDEATGTSANQPANLSRTYIWVGLKPPPITEQYQFMGDPRHMPYADVKLDKRYNWYFGVNPNLDGYAGFDNATGLWDPDSDEIPTPLKGVNVDVPRYFEVFRMALMNSNSILVHPVGPLASHIALGGEVGWGPEQNSAFTDGIKINKYYWNPAITDETQTYNVDEMHANSVNPDKDHLHLIADKDAKWYGRYWLGELYPDDEYNVWSSSGNLRVGDTLKQYFKKVNFGEAESVPGKPLPENDRYLDADGAAAFFNGTPNGQPTKFFAHDTSVNPDSTVETAMQDFANAAHIRLTTMDAPFAFRIDEADTTKRHADWNTAPYSTDDLRTTLEVVESFYETPGNESTHDSSALIHFWNKSDPSKVGRVVVNGFSEIQSNHSNLKISVLQGIYARMVAGQDTMPNRMVQIPSVRQKSPKSGSLIYDPGVSDSAYLVIKASANWARWDDQPYHSSNYPTSNQWSEEEHPEYEYFMAYSNDNGSTYKFIDDNAVYDLKTERVADSHWIENLSVASDFDFSWDISDPSLFPQGEYLLTLVGRQKNFSEYEYSNFYSRIKINRP